MVTEKYDLLMDQLELTQKYELLKDAVKDAIACILDWRGKLRPLATLDMETAICKIISRDAPPLLNKTHEEASASDAKNVRSRIMDLVAACDCLADKSPVEQIAKSLQDLTKELDEHSNKRRINEVAASWDGGLEGLDLVISALDGLRQLKLEEGTIQTLKGLRRTSLCAAIHVVETKELGFSFPVLAAYKAIHELCKPASSTEDETFDEQAIQILQTGFNTLKFLDQLSCYTDSQPKECRACFMNALLAVKDFNRLPAPESQQAEHLPELGKFVEALNGAAAQDQEKRDKLAEDLQVSLERDRLHKT